MQRSLVTAALAGAVMGVPSVQAQTGNVVLYGRANLSVDTYSATGGTCAPGVDCNFKSRTRVTDSASRLGVRGIEDLGSGLRAVFQIETGVNIDTGQATGQSGALNGNTGFLASRDSFVGLEGGFGRLTLGRQNIYWANGTIIQTGANYINAEIPFSSAVIFGRVTGPVARQSNVLQYTTPTFGGFNTTLSYSPQSEAAGAGTQTDSRVLGVTARWASGPIAIQGDWAKNQAATPAAGVRPEVTGMKGLAGFTYMPGAQISVLYIRLEDKIGNAGAGLIPGPQAGFSAAGDTVKQSAWMLSWEHMFGNIQALAQYGQLGKVTGCTIAGACDSTEARAYMVGGRYLVSKRTALYATYNVVTNKANQTLDYVGGGISSAPNVGLLPGIAPGADPKILALGIIHNF